jgi:dolichol-phosphate mannosyltransferase
MRSVISLPVYNEEQSIKNLIEEIQALQYFKKIIIINDCSTDKTNEYLQEIKCDELIVISNKINLGHGPSTLVGMKYATNLDCDVIVTADGDGHYRVVDLKLLSEKIFDLDLDIIEGIRTQRTDPWFRKLTSLVTRSLVRIRSKTHVEDANTPIRAYRHDVLKVILSKVPSPYYPIPNLFISATSRKMNFRISGFHIPTSQRNTVSELGVTWQQKFRTLPSKNYIKFCLEAVRSWYFSK